MAKRRPLVAGLKAAKPSDPKKEAEFVYAAKSRTTLAVPEPQPPTPAVSQAPVPTPVPAENASPSPTGRTPLSTKLRADLAAALKRASLERQLAGVAPHTLQDILEAVLEPWLRDNGYLK